MSTWCSLANYFRWWNKLTKLLSGIRPSTYRTVNQNLIVGLQHIRWVLIHCVCFTIKYQRAARIVIQISSELPTNTPTGKKLNQINARLRTCKFFCVYLLVEKMLVSRYYATAALLLSILVPFTLFVDGQRNNGNSRNGTVNGRQNINSAALLIGAAGLAAVGTAGFIGGLIIGENDAAFRDRRRRPFRGKRNLAAITTD